MCEVGGGGRQAGWLSPERLTTETGNPVWVLSFLLFLLPLVTFIHEELQALRHRGCSVHEEDPVSVLGNSCPQNSETHVGQSLPPSCHPVATEI